jgi:hypothetical protein
LKFSQNIFLFSFVFCANIVHGQFPPAAGKPGSTAISGDSSCFLSWAIEATSEIGYRQNGLTDSGFASVGNNSSVIGPSRKNGVLSLGDGGWALLKFNPPIINGPGFDFAVFENAFNDSFLELAHVEVSEDGIRFYRFPSVSLTQTNFQTSSFGATMADSIHNLAGKYRMPYGTPFDLEDFVDSPEFPSSIYFVKIIDVIGNIEPQKGSTDSRGNIINDPWPTPFISSGFDLDAVGVINQGQFNSTEKNPILARIYHNVQQNTIVFPRQVAWAELISMNGQFTSLKIENQEANVDTFSPGIYTIRCNLGLKRIVISE